MISDFRTPGYKVPVVDLCIIGAGPAGISLAKSFLNSKYMVCLLESGGLEFDLSTQSLYKGDVVGLEYFPLDSARLRYFGGASNHWGGLCAPLDEWDFKDRTWVPDSGWPFNKNELESYYVKSQELCGLGPYEYDPSKWIDDTYQLFDKQLSKNFVTKMWHFTPRRFSFGEVYRKELGDSKNVHVLLNANVTDIVSNNQGKAVQGVSVSTLDGGKKEFVKSRVVVLACGGLENPRLLLISNSIFPHGIGNENGIVGRYFMEHPHVHVGELLTTKNSQELSYYGDILIRNRTHLRPAFSVSAGSQQTLGISGAAMWANPMLGQDHWKGYESLRQIVRAFRGPRSRMSTILDSGFADDIFNVVTDMDGVAEALYYRLKGIRKAIPKKTEVICFAMLEQFPNPDSRVTLSKKLDALGLPRIQLDWRLTDGDKRSLRVMSQLFGEETGKLGIGRLRVRSWILSEEDNWQIVGGYHHMGTTRMNQSPIKGVVDQNCRVHGLDNLFIAGSSVFPTSGVSNPTLTIVALAVRLAEHLKSQVLS